MAKAPTKRSISIKVNLTPELHERLREVAAQLGQAPATVASMGISQYITTLRQTLTSGQRMVDNLAAHAGPAMVELMKEQMKLGEKL